VSSAGCCRCLSLIAETGNIYAGLYYPMIVAGITFIIGSIFLRETHGHKIWAEMSEEVTREDKK
jgi:hypothetical protein